MTILVIFFENFFLESISIWNMIKMNDCDFSIQDFVQGCPLQILIF